MTNQELSKLSDADLMVHVLEGSDFAIYVLHERKKGMLKGYLHNLLHDEYRREEVFQETWIKLCKFWKAHPGMEIKNIDGLICRSAYNVAFPRKRKTELEFIPLDDEMQETVKDERDDESMYREQCKLLDKHIDMLSPRKKNIVLLRHQGYSFVAIEAMLKLRAHTASSQYSKAVKIILESFGINTDENIF
jgi:DNA-directed RNA polymerase specialized sigma24 family protein